MGPTGAPAGRGGPSLRGGSTGERPRPRSGQVRISLLIRDALRRIARASPNLLFWVLAVFGLLAILFAAMLVIPSWE